MEKEIMIKLKEEDKEKILYAMAIGLKLYGQQITAFDLGLDTSYCLKSVFKQKSIDELKESFLLLKDFYNELDK